jgi:hypothetical protein
VDFIAVVFADAVLAARGPTTSEEWLGAGIVLGSLVLVLAVLFPWALRRFDRQRDADCARLAAESAAFRTQWPADRVWQAPYLDVEAELVRSWRLVLLLENRNEKRQSAELHARIAAVRGWIATLLGPLNAAAAREHRTVG